MRQRYDLVLYKDFMFYGRQIDGAVFVAPDCRTCNCYSKFVDRMPYSEIDLIKENLSLSDVIYYIVRFGKDPSNIFYFPSSASKGSFKDFLSEFNNISLLYDDDKFVGIFMQEDMFNV